MAVNLGSTAQKLATAINIKHKTHIVINHQAFFGAEGNQVNMKVVKDAYSIGGEHSDQELFRSVSGVYVILFLRDLMRAMDGEEVEPPEDNEGYYNIFMKRDVLGSIKYMKEKYIGTHR